MSKHKKKEHKRHKHKKDKHHKKKSSRASDESSSATSSDNERHRKTSSDKEKQDMAAITNKEQLVQYFNSKLSSNPASTSKYMISQQSEALMFDRDTEPLEKTESFQWKKKIQKLGYDKLEPEQLHLFGKIKQEETQRELEKLKKRKIERDREREDADREREFLQREKEVEYHKEWEKQEDSFHLQQVKLRSKIRLEEGRAKPIDLLAKYISDHNDDTSTVIHEPPYLYLNGLTIRDLEDLLADIKVYSGLEKGSNAQFWYDITIVAEDELKKLQRHDKCSTDHAGDRREGINESVLNDVNSLIKGKSYQQLTELEDHVKRKIDDKESGVDIGYWESLLAQLKTHMARARLKDTHDKCLPKKWELIKRQQDEERRKAGVNRRGGAGTSSESFNDSVEKKIEERIKKEEVLLAEKGESSSEEEEEEEEDMYQQQDEEMESEEADQTDQITASLNAYINGRYSPRYVSPDKLPFDTFIVSQDEDSKRLEIKRDQVRGTGKLKTVDEEESFQKMARDSMIGFLPEVDEQGGGAKGGGAGPAALRSNTKEIPLEHQYLWSDKYRARKPRYYNRVHTGYDWNPYNKKHYDIDNPPPKTVQGYKFNIFYPDLIDKTKTPSYSITPCEDNKDFAIIRFRAGPPYEDVAFKIVNREWDISHRHGFRNQFQNGIYQLWYHFRKWKFRR